MNGKCATCGKPAVIWSEGADRCQACYGAIVERRVRIQQAFIDSLPPVDDPDAPTCDEFVPDLAAAFDAVTVREDLVFRNEPRPYMRDFQQ